MPSIPRTHTEVDVYLAAEPSTTSLATVQDLAQLRTLLVIGLIPGIISCTILVIFVVFIFRKALHDAIASLMSIRISCGRRRPVEVVHLPRSTPEVSISQFIFIALLSFMILISIVQIVNL